MGGREMKTTIFSLLLALACVANVAFAQTPRTVVSTDKAPKAIGPYSQAVVAGNLVFVSGQLGIDPQTNMFVKGGIKEQTEQVLHNLSAVLVEAGSSLESVASCTVYLKDMNDFAAMNDIYAKFFIANPPSRATVQVARLPKDGLVEISCIATKP
jgi:2-iminobutanoate/2-iminopropanoate deaminase